MSETLPAATGPPGGAQPGGAPRALRIFGLAAVGVGLAALAAATFVLSYPGIHAIALQAGISPRLARGYPLLLDAMLVVVLAAVLSLRGAGVPSKLLAWLTLVALLGATAGADALHAAKDKLPARAAEITAAVLPWVLVLLAFVLLLAMLRHARLRRLQADQQASQPHDAGQGLTRQPTAAPDILPGFRILPGQVGPVTAPDAAAAAQEATVADTRAPASSEPAGNGPTAGAAILQPRISVPRQREPASDTDAGATDPGIAGRGQDEEATGPQADTDAGPGPGPDADHGHDTEPGPDPDAHPGPDADLGPEADPGPDADAHPRPDADPRPHADLAIEADLAADEPDLDEPDIEPTSAEPAVAASPRDESRPGWPAAEPAADSYRIGTDRPAESALTEGGTDRASTPTGTISPAPTSEAESPDPDMPVFHRISSSPVPPGGV